MLTYSSLGKNGNLGNQLFQIASTIGLAKKHGHNYFFPPWKFADNLKNILPSGEKDESYILLEEKQFDFHEWPINNCNYDIAGWLQSEKYFDIKLTREIFTFKYELRATILSRSKDLFSKTAILISIRRGDFVRNPGAYQLSYKFYFLALQEHFPDANNYNFIFTSDDITYCKRHFSFMTNAFFLDGYNSIEQLIIASECDHFVISNSTFSWWAAWLGEKPGTKIIRPLKNMRGKAALLHNNKDYFPDRWLIFPHEDKSVGLRHWKLFLIGEAGELYDSMRIFLKNSKTAFKAKVKKMIDR